MQSAERRRSSVETTNSAMFDEGGLADLLQPTDEPVRTSSFARSTDRKASRRGSREVSVTPSAEVASQRSTPEQEKEVMWRKPSAGDVETTSATNERLSLASAEATSPVSIEAIVFRGQSVPVETAWTVELPRSPEAFSVDVNLSNGMSVVVSNRKELEGRWFVIAKDAPSRQHLVARFQRREDGMLWSPALNYLRHGMALLGSPFSSDLSTLFVLLLAVAVTLAPASKLAPAASTEASAVALTNYSTWAYGFSRLDRATVATAAASARGVNRAASRLLEPAGAARVAGWLELGGTALQEAHGLNGGVAFYRMLLLLSLCFAFAGRVAGKLSATFPPRCTYTLVVKTSTEAIDVDGGAGGDSKAPSGLPMLEGHSSIFKLGQLFAAAIVVEGGGSGGGGGAEGGALAVGGADDAELPISVEKFCDAFQEMMKQSSVLGPLMALAIKNDEGNLRKLTAAWRKQQAVDKPKCETCRGLLEVEKASGIHRPGGVLADPSAAIALIWMRRSLEFLRSVHALILEDLDGDAPSTGNSSLSAFAKHAYAEHLEHFHNWLLKNTFAMALNGMPSRNEVFRRLAPHIPEPQRTRIVVMELRECIKSINKVTDSLKLIFAELDLEDTRKV